MDTPVYYYYSVSVYEMSSGSNTNYLIQADSDKDLIPKLYREILKTIFGSNEDAISTTLDMLGSMSKEELEKQLHEDLNTFYTHNSEDATLEDFQDFMSVQDCIVSNIIKIKSEGGLNYKPV